MSNKQELQEAQTVSPVLLKVKAFISEEKTKRRFDEVLGTKAAQFTSSLVNVVAGNTTLQKCEPSSIMNAAFVAASVDLMIDPNLGFAAIVPYWNSKEKKYIAQFQMMYRGFIQLAMRSGQYRKIHCAEVYEDEFVNYNPITNEITFVSDLSNTTQRKDGMHDKVVGYYSTFTLGNGFSHDIFMTQEEMQSHAKRYSSAFQNDIKKGWKVSKWTTDFIAMGKKTVLKLILSKWGPLSIQLQQAITDDQKVFDDEKGRYLDNPDNMPIDTTIDNPFDGKTQKQLDKEDAELASQAQDAVVNEDQSPPEDDSESIY